jgi:hypothetical protein
VAGRWIGGHAYVGYGVDRDAFGGYVQCVSSWGTGYGLGGSFRLRLSDLAVLLRTDAEACAPTETPLLPIPIPEPPPPPPLPPEPDWPYYVGPDLKAALLRNGDVPLNREDYAVNHLGMDIGYSIIHALHTATGRDVRYTWLKDQKRYIREEF